jgi:hypothetical protein
MGVRLKEKPAKKKVLKPFKWGLKLRKPSILVVN